MHASFELTPDELNADFLDKVKALFQGKEKLAINITDSKDGNLPSMSFEEACKKKLPELKMLLIRKLHHNQLRKHFQS